MEGHPRVSNFSSVVFGESDEKNHFSRLLGLQQICRVTCKYYSLSGATESMTHNIYRRVQFWYTSRTELCKFDVVAIQAHRNMH